MQAYIIPCYGTNGLTGQHVELLKKHNVKEIYICFDADESGNKAANVAFNRLKEKDLKAHIVHLPEGQDINDFFSLTAQPKPAFNLLLLHANPEGAKAIKEKTIMKKTDNGFSTIIANRTYEVLGISKTHTKIKATVKGIKQEQNKKRFHVDTVDFYSARSRAFLIKGFCDLFEEDDHVITDDMQKLLEMSEQYCKPKENQEKSKEQISQEAYRQAMAFLKNVKMFDEILSDFETVGYTGEEMNKLLCYVAAVSRKIEEPISVIIQSRSAAGKSFLQDTVLSLIPEEDTIKYTRLTDQALFYKDKDSLKHKILAIEELDGMNGAIYSIRSIQSSKKITIAYTGKDPATGKMSTEENTVEGPLVVFITTTQVEIDGETASRFVFLSIDESKEMTEKILAKQRQNYTKEGMIRKLEASLIIEKHQNASRLLKPLGVINPYAELLTFTSKSLRARRDHIKYQNLILSIAYLFQYQRKTVMVQHDNKSVECVVVTLADIEKANAIADQVLGRSLDELPPPSRTLYKLVRNMVKDLSQKTRTSPKEFNFTMRNIREYSGWSDFQVRTHIKQLVELEYLYVVMGKKGREYVYELLVDDEIKKEDKPFLVGLISIKKLKEKAKKKGIKDD